MRPRAPLSKVDTALSTVDARVLPRLSPYARWLRLRVRQVRARPLPVLAVLAVLVAAGFTVANAMSRPDPAPLTPDGTVWVGPHQGDSVPAYLAQGQAKLAALAAQSPQQAVYALVALDRYATPDEVAGLVAAAPGVVSVTGRARVPLAGRQTELVSLVAIRPPGDLVVAMASVATRKEEDAANYDRLAAQQPPGTLRQIYLSNAEVSRAEAAAYRAGCGCVFALVVWGTPEALLTLAAQPMVRVVDPAPEVADPADAVFEPLLPEHTERVAPLPDELLPTATG
jgi:hypothetical protein